MKGIWVAPVEGRLIQNPDDNYMPIVQPVLVANNTFWRGTIADGDLEKVTEEEAEAQIKKIAEEKAGAEEAERKEAEEKAAAEQSGVDKTEQTGEGTGKQDPVEAEDTGAFKAGRAKRN